jgi:hypothetical protein
MRLRNGSLIAALLVSALALCLLSGCSDTQTGAAGAPPTPPSASTQAPQETTPGIGAVSVLVVHGKIVSVDQEKKLITLEGPNGKRISLHANNPYNLAAAKAGESFVAKFYEITTFQKLMPGQQPPAPSLTAGFASAEAGQAPGAMLGAHLRFTVKIDAINKTDGTISVEGPDGVVETVKAANPENLDKVQVGDRVVVTLTDAVVLSLAKEPA